MCEIDPQQQSQHHQSDAPRPPIGMENTAFHREIAELARIVMSQARPSVQAVAQRSTALASTYIAGVDHASIMLITANAVRSVASTGGYADLVDKIQDTLGEGPGLRAALGYQTLRVNDLNDEARWPRFSQAVLSETPVRSMLCLPLSTHTQNWGSLNLHSNQQHDFTAQEQQAGEILAIHAAMLLARVHRSRPFHAALGSRDIIGQAKGIIMERFNLGAPRAFELLARLAQEADKPVVVIAKQILQRKNSERLAQR